MRRSMVAVPLVILSVVVAACSSSPSANTTTSSSSSSVTQGLNYYRGKTVTIIEPGATGAIFDLIARTEATYLGRYLHATVNVEDVTIGNTIPGQDETASAAPNGLTLGILDLGNDASLALTHTPGLNFDVRSLQFIAANAASSDLMVARASSPYTSLSAILHASPPPTVLMENTGTTDVLTASLFGILGVHADYVVGYTSIGSYVQGFSRGDGPIMMTNLASTGALVKGGQARPILVTSVPPAGTLYRQYVLKVPTFASIKSTYPPKTATQKKEWAALDAFLGATSTPLVTQARVPSDEVAALRQAAVWMFAQAGFKTAILRDGQNPDYVSPSAAKGDYAAVLKDGSVLEPFFARFT